jgi:hypothetical protein
VCIAWATSALLPSLSPPASGKNFLFFLWYK